MEKNVVELVIAAGGAVVSKNILTGKGLLTFCVREAPVNDVDNGWRFFSDIDSEEYLADENNLSIVDFNTVANIEPAILALYNMPIGTDIILDRKQGDIEFYDNCTGQKIEIG